MNGATLTVQDITKSFNTCTALDSVSFSIQAGQTVLIGGANGSGKSVLMSIIAGLTKPSSGTVTITDVHGNKAQAGLVFQDADAQILGETPLEDVSYGPINAGVSKKDALLTAHTVLEQCGLGQKKTFPARFLSGGEKRRLAVAGILALDRPLIIFDEPYANLDYEGVKQVNSLIALLQRQQRTIVILTHELEKSMALCSQFIVLYKGKKVFDGTPQEGLKQKLTDWSIRNPLTTYTSWEDLVWL
ncbi:MAG: energy-coupling factor ABC transporter ATP-binding protein [Treponema sp.]|nr:energy-coupling factor ABC transporter ATP-binding protein [Treponema sp.]